MAKRAHLRILKQGVDAWNQWRAENRSTVPDLEGANLFDINLRAANLRETMLPGADLIWADLREADLTGADLTGADLRSADLGAADLTATDLSSTNLEGTHMEGSNLSHALMGLTLFGENDLGTVKGLHTVLHSRPSTIGIDTIYKSKGKIAEVFLRRAGVPEDFIVYMRSLVGKAIEFYSCFISYSSQDDDFAQRLHADLQQKGVRCWFAAEDLKIGDKFRTRIDESIRIYDKVMVVLSENSIPSGWVEKEVETAFEREQREKKLVLFPIRLDDAVMETNQAWAADIRRVRHIGDFRAWKDHDQYQKSFERLLRDLKA